ncbi:MAG: hypothetical protein IPJ41_12920 [Phycisphaerales bacterium]|nr:hypothetical protein [Phycisphaerales bacterium]
MHHDADERLTRLEEATLFAERRLDELHEEVLGLSGLLAALAARVSRLEQSPRDEPEPPALAEGP